MGQILEKLQGTNTFAHFNLSQFDFLGEEFRRRRLGTITDNFFDRFKNDSGRANLTFEDLYIAVLLVYNDINKHLPGPHFDPPSKEKVRAMIQDCDINLDGELNREEFVGFIHQLTADTFTLVSQGLITTLAVAPTVAILTKKATEGLPGVGVVVQRLPTSVYASLVTLAVMLYQKSFRALE
ncbi:uncharacterized protein LOC127787262 [Diospyros lotus]|uniref:uncharacterized protein LOC127787262 n=1 Tax=Diospyros lotus TaxID=55363 RepID=UPI0022550CBF|nr:uncharacterized protein LOC127787262 [Diospyros lotus]